MKIVNENKLSVEQLILRLSNHERALWSEFESNPKVQGTFDRWNELSHALTDLGIGVEDRDNMRCIEL